MKRAGKWIMLAVMVVSAGWWCSAGGGASAWFLSFFLGAAAVASACAALFALQGAAAERELPLAAPIGGESFEVTLHIHRKSWIPFVWLAVTDCWEADHDGRRSYEYRTLLFPWFKRDIVCRYRVHRLPRGSYRFRELILETGDMFGMVTKRRRITLADKLVVLPQPMFLSGLRVPGASGEERPVLSRASSASIAAGMVRSYAPGDPIRRIHWRSSAKRGELMTRMEESAQASRLMIYLDASAEAYRPALPAPLFEKSVQIAAGFLKLIAEQGIEGGLSVSSAISLHVPPTRSPSDIRHAVRALAELAPDGRIPLAKLLELDAQAAFGSSCTAVCITPKLDRAFAEAVARLRAGRRQALVVYVHPHQTLPLAERAWRETFAQLGVELAAVPCPRSEWEVMPYVDAGSFAASGA